MKNDPSLTLLCLHLTKKDGEPEPWKKYIAFAANDLGIETGYCLGPPD